MVGVEVVMVIVFLIWHFTFRDPIMARPQVPHQAIERGIPR